MRKTKEEKVHDFLSWCIHIRIKLWTFRSCASTHTRRHQNIQQTNSLSLVSIFSIYGVFQSRVKQWWLPELRNWWRYVISFLETLTSKCSIHQCFQNAYFIIYESLYWKHIVLHSRIFEHCSKSILTISKCFIQCKEMSVDKVQKFAFKALNMFNSIYT